MFTFDDFRSKVKKDGLARQNRFYISIALPNLKGETARLFSGSSQELRDLHLLCKSVNIPGVSVASSPLRLTGEQIEVPYDRTFSSATFTFYVDRKMIVRKFFDDWVDTMQNHQTRAMGWYKDFVAPSIVVFVCDKQSREVYATVLYDAHVKSIGSLQLEQQTNDVMTFDVTFDYHYYATVLIDQPDLTAEQSTRSQRLTKEGTLGPVGNRPPSVTDLRTSVDPTQFIQSISDFSAELINPMNAFVDSLGLGQYTENFTEFQEVFQSGLGELTYAGQPLVGAINQAYGRGMQQFDGIKSNAMSAVSSVKTLSTGISSLGNFF